MIFSLLGVGVMAVLNMASPQMLCVPDDARAIRTICKRDAAPVKAVSEESRHDLVVRPKRTDPVASGFLFERVEL
jgi:hypothetical protein